jgi:hypothetical protein
MTPRKIIGALVTLLSFGLIDTQGGQIELVAVDDSYSYGDERDPDAQFIGVEFWDGVRGEAWIDSNGDVVGGDLYFEDGSEYDGYWWGTADEYWDEFYGECHSYGDGNEYCW